MHRAAVLFLMAPFLVWVSCSKPRVQTIATIEEQEAPLKDAIRSNDPADELQFVSGFYPAERDGWRWTRGHFTVALMAPPDAGTRGAVLELGLDVPQVVLDPLGPVTVSAMVGGVALAPETRAHAGLVPYRRMVPAAAFSRREVLVEFTLDKVVKPNTMPGEDRELGAAVHGATLLPAKATEGQ